MDAVPPPPAADRSDEPRLYVLRTDGRRAGETLRESSFLMVVAVCVTVIAVIAAIVIITVARPEKDNSTIIVLIPGFATTTLAALFGALKATETKTSVQQLGFAVNGRLSQLLEQTTRAQRAEGHLEGREAARTELIPVVQEAVRPVVKEALGTLANGATVIVPVPSSDEPRKEG